MKQTITLNLTERILTTPDQLTAIYFMGSTELSNEKYELNFLYEKRYPKFNDATTPTDTPEVLNGLITHPIKLTIRMGDILSFSEELGNTLHYELKGLLLHRQVEAFFNIKRVQVRDLLPTSVVLDLVYHEQLDQFENVS